MNERDVYGLTVSGAFALAGHGTPEGAEIKCYMLIDWNEDKTKAGCSARTWLYLDPAHGYAVFDALDAPGVWTLVPEPAKGEVDPLFFVCLLSLNLSNLPAKDAFDALPFTVQAVLLAHAPELGIADPKEPLPASTNKEISVNDACEAIGVSIEDVKRLSASPVDGKGGE